MNFTTGISFTNLILEDRFIQIVKRKNMKTSICQGKCVGITCIIATYSKQNYEQTTIERKNANYYLKKIRKSL